MQLKEPTYKIRMTGSVTVPERTISEEIAFKIIALIMGGVSKPTGRGANENLQAGAGSGEVNDGLSPKEFMVMKKPSSEIERITCLAFYLSKYRNISAFKTKNLTKLNIEAAQPSFSNPTVFARNAETAGYLAKAGGGSKQISPLGESLVNALPDREKVKAVIKANIANRKRRSATKRGSRMQ